MASHQSQPSWSTRLLGILGVAVLYFGAAQLGLLAAFEKTNASPVWPPSGIAFAAVLLLGYRVWPGIVIGAFSANIVGFLANQSADIWTSVAVSGAISIGNTLEALSGMLLLRLCVDSGQPFHRIQNVFKFVAVTLVMCVTSATIGATSLGVFGIAPWTLFGTIWLTWWVGDIAGVLILTPMITTWWRLQPIQSDMRWLVKVSAFVIILFGIGQFIFGGWLPSVGFSKAYLIIPLLLWAVFGFGQLVATTAVTLVSAMAIWGTVNGLGPFATASLNESLLSLQSFVCIISVTMLSLGAALCERQDAEAALKILNENLEQRVTERTAALEEINAEMESFTYSVSHDLRAPLRAMHGFSDALLEDYGDTLDDTGRDYAQRIVAAAERMNALIQDLLTYSRLSRTEITLKPVDLQAVVKDILAQLEAEIEDKAARITIDKSFPQVVGHRPVLTQVIANLLTNALKFVETDVQPQITLRADANQRTIRFWVEDNGIGIAPEHQDRIFRIFERLHGIETYPGTGLGLAIVRKGMERTGGRIGVESKEGKGSRFWLELPRVEGYT